LHKKYPIYSPNEASGYLFIPEKINKHSRVIKNNNLSALRHDAEQLTLPKIITASLGVKRNLVTWRTPPLSLSGD
jgi:hypothetical protein